MEQEPCEVTRFGEWRERSGLTLSEVSGLTGLTVSMLSKVARGEATVAPLTKVSMARALGVDVEDLFEPPKRLKAAS